MPRFARRADEIGPYAATANQTKTTEGPGGVNRTGATESPRGANQTGVAGSPGTLAPQ